MDHACGTCQYFQADPTDHRARRRSTGICTHPVHRSRGVAIVIFPQETRCRRGFGDDDWTPAGLTRPDWLPPDPGGPRGTGAPPADIVIDERPSPLNRTRRVLPRFAPIPIYVNREDAVAD